MPEYLAPGVFIEEISFRNKSIEGVGTSVSSLVGPTRTGPLRGVPEVVTSYSEFERIFGDASDLTFSDPALTVPNYTAHAARAFFDNGGKQLYVARVIQDVNKVNSDGSGGSAAVAKSDAAVTDVAFQSRFPGATGDYALELLWRESENLLTNTQLGSADDQEIVFIDATSVPASAKTTGPANDKFPVDVKGVFKRNGANYEVVGTAITTEPGTTNPVDGTALGGLKIAQLPGATTHVYRIRARRPVNGVLADGTAAVLKLKKSVDLTALNAAWVLGSATSFIGFINERGNTLTLSKARNATLSTDLDLPLAALGNNLTDIKSVAVSVFDLDVHRGDKNGEVVWRAAAITIAPGTAQSLDKVLSTTPEKKAEQLAQPISCKLTANVTGAKVLAALEKLYKQSDLLPPSDSLDDPRYIIELKGGTDGKAPGAVDYAGEEDDTKGSTGFASLEGIDDISIVMTPAAAAHEGSHKAVLMEVQKHCRKMRYRIGIADSREGMSLGEVRAFRNDFDDSRLAFYYPWVVVADPTGKRNELTVPPAGFIAGIYVRTDVDRGVHKAPANEVVMGALRFEQEVNKFQQELLNPNGINCLRSFPGRGHRVWGVRTLSSDPEWKYVNVRRYFLYLERSIEKSTQWAVFEPNGEALWANIRSSVEDFLFNEWRNGRLLGSTPKEAYFVRCDRSTMTQNDIDSGRMVCVVGVAALTPAEFVIFRIGQKTADA